MGIRSALLLGVWLLSTAAGYASSFYEPPFPDTVRGASNIVRGKIGKSEVQWVTLPDGSKRIFTFYDVEVSETFKGEARRSTVRIRELGGEKDGVGLRVSGSAEFSPGEDVVLMLGEAVDGTENTYPLNGMMMGKYTLEKGADGKEYLRGSGLGSTVHPSLRKGAAAKDVQVSLEGLREIVRAQASEPRPTKEASVANARPAQEPLLAARAGGGESHEEENLVPSEAPRRPKPAFSGRAIYALLGLAVGGFFWFLKTRKKRR